MQFLIKKITFFPAVKFFVIKRLDPDPDRPKILDLDPESMNPDSKETVQHTTTIYEHCTDGGEEGPGDQYLDPLYVTM